jgi:hypothetical protein
VSLVRTDVSEELSASIIKVTRIGELVITLAVTSNRRKLRRNTLMKEAPNAFETAVLTRAILRNIPEDAILHSHRCENLKSYKEFRIASNQVSTSKPSCNVSNKNLPYYIFKSAGHRWCVDTRLLMAVEKKTGR